MVVWPVTTQRKNKLMTWVRDGIIIAFITVLIFVAIEVFIRIFMSQTEEWLFVSGGTLGLEDGILGHRNRPNTHAIHQGPEFSVEYIVNAQGLRDLSTYQGTKPDGTPGFY